jgi:hypothetical protein
MEIMNAMFTHRISNIKCKIQGHAYLGQEEKAESFRELLRMINRDHIKTLTQLNKEMKKRNLN